MKQLFFSLFFFTVINICYGQPKMQATLKQSTTPRTIDIFLKSSTSFSQKDESMTFAVAVPGNVLPGPTLGSSGVTANTLGPVEGIAGLQPTFLVNNLACTQREVFVSTQTINNVLYYIYTFIFAGTSPVDHDWIANEEQLIFSIQFNGCTTNCSGAQLLVNLPNGGDHSISYWYFQPNTLGDITNYVAPFYANTQSGLLVNGGSADGSALSTIDLQTSVSLSMKIKPVRAILAARSVAVEWDVKNESGVKQYEVETSADGTTFSTAAVKIPTGNNNSNVTYSWQDMNAATTNNFYRIRTTSLNGQVQYSEIVTLKLANTKAGYQVYPNPITNGIINLQFINQPKGLYTVHLFNSMGQVVLSKQISYTGGSSTERIELGNKIAKGFYVLEVTGAGSKQSIKITY